MLEGVKVAIGGKGGVGKTTVSAVWARLFAVDGLDVLAIDADSDANLWSAFGIDPGRRPEPLINMRALISERTGGGKEAVGAYFKLNPHVADLPEKFWIDLNHCDGGSLRLLTLGGLKHGGGGCACPEGAFLKAMLTNTILHRRELAIVDMAAGVEFMGRASIQGIDALVTVVEPGSRSIATAINIATMGRDLGIHTVAAVLNKITDPGQAEAVESPLAAEGIVTLGRIEYSPSVQQADLNQDSVFNADEETVDALKLAKTRLSELIGSKLESSKQQ